MYEFLSGIIATISEKGVIDAEIGYRLILQVVYFGIRRENS